MAQKTERLKQIQLFRAWLQWWRYSCSSHIHEIDVCVRVEYYYYLQISMHACMVMRKRGAFNRVVVAGSSASISGGFECLGWLGFRWLC